MIRIYASPAKRMEPKCYDQSLTAKAYIKIAPTYSRIAPAPTKTASKAVLFHRKILTLR